MSEPRAFTAAAPGKVILLGEHAVNRGQPALSAAVGLYARCRVTAGGGDGYRFRSGAQSQEVPREALPGVARRFRSYQEAGDFEAIRRMAADDYFAPQKLILTTAFGAALPEGLELEWESEIPGSSGLGSGGAAFTAMVAAIRPLLPEGPDAEQRAAWAHLGDMVAHGGVASRLDTQTSRIGGVIRFADGEAEPVRAAPGLSLVIGDTGVHAATSEVNSRVRQWVEARPAARKAIFGGVGALVRAALPLLERSEWEELGRLLTLNQLLLEKIGVSCPEIDALIDAALEAGAYGAKLSGSGGGGIIVALVPEGKREEVAAAIRGAGGRPLLPPVGVSGVSEPLPSSGGRIESNRKEAR